MQNANLSGPSSSSLLVPAETTKNTANNNALTEKSYVAKLPWGATKEKHNTAYNKGLVLNLKNATNFDSSLASSTGSEKLENSYTNKNDNPTPASRVKPVEKQKPGEYVMHLLMLNFIQVSSKKFSQVVSSEKQDKRLKECVQRMDDPQFDQLVQTMGQVAEQCLPSLTKALLVWHESQMSNLSYLKQQHQAIHKQQVDAAQASNANSKTILKVKQQLLQQKLENELLDERKELVIHAILCICLIEVLKQLSFHPGNDELLGYIIDLCFNRFLAKET